MRPLRYVRVSTANSTDYLFLLLMLLLPANGAQTAPLIPQAAISGMSLPTAGASPAPLPQLPASASASTERLSSLSLQTRERGPCLATGSREERVCACSRPRVDDTRALRDRAGRWRERELRPYVKVRCVVCARVRRGVVCLGDGSTGRRGWRDRSPELGTLGRV